MGLRGYTAMLAFCAHARAAHNSALVNDAIPLSFNARLTQEANDLAHLVHNHMLVDALLKSLSTPRDGSLKRGGRFCMKRGPRGPRTVLNLHLCVRRSGVFGVEMKTLP